MLENEKAMHKKQKGGKSDIVEAEAVQKEYEEQVTRITGIEVFELIVCKRDTQEWKG